MTLSKRLLASIVLFLIPLAILLVARPLCEGLGLRGTYYRDAAWRDEAFARVDGEMTTRALTPAVRSLDAQPFSARWDGFLHVPRGGRYVFQLVSDDGAWLELNGRQVIDNGGDHGPVLEEASLHLPAGLHTLTLRYFQNLGGWRMNLLWAAEGQDPEALGSPSVMHVPMRGWRYAAARLLHASLPYIPFVWLAAAGVFASGAAASLLRRLGVAESLTDRGLLAVLASSVALNAVGISWGINGRWAPDEILPGEVVEAVGLRFANGWHGPYPPVQYYVLGLIYAPFLIAEWFMALPVAFPLHLLNRSVSVIMAAFIVVLCYVIARTLNGRAAGLAAAILTSLLLPFVYYAKTSNVDVPYLFWFSWAMLFYVRIITSGETGAYAGFAVAAAIATATKDQAYAFFVGPFIHAAVLRYSRLRRAPGGAARSPLRDAVVPGAALLGVATFALAQNLLFNWEGFARHIAVLRVNSGDTYRMFPATLEGHLASSWAALTQVRFAFGWPASLLIVAALFSTVRHGGRRARLWLLLPAASYYGLFIVPVAIVFDRFMLGICILLAAIAGSAVADWMRGGGRARLVTLACVAAVTAYSAARAISLDAMMLDDSRFVVEEWMARQVPADATLLSVGPRAFLPRLDWTARLDRPSAEPVDAATGEYVVVNATYARRFSPSSREGVLYERLRDPDRFSLVFRHRSTATWFPLSRDPVFVDVAESQFTNLDKVNPLVEVYRRN